MPVTEIVFSEEDDTKLRDEYHSMCATWMRLGRKNLPPTYEQWLGGRAVSGDGMPSNGADLDDIRVFNAVEKLVTSLAAHNLALAQLDQSEGAKEKSTGELAETIVAGMRLPAPYLKRLQELFEHYLKDAKQVADAAHVMLTNRAYVALNEAYRKLLERTSQAAKHIGSERAIGRAEGAVAILVALDVLDRSIAEKRTRAFKAELRKIHKESWVGKVFGGASSKS